jgi:hypothetical protein
VEGVGARGITLAATLLTFNQIEAGQDLDRLFAGEAADNEAAAAKIDAGESLTRN